MFFHVHKNTSRNSLAACSGESLLRSMRLERWTDFWIIKRTCFSKKSAPIKRKSPNYSTKSREWPPKPRLWKKYVKGFYWLYRAKLLNIGSRFKISNSLVQASAYPCRVTMKKSLNLSNFWFTKKWKYRNLRKNLNSLRPMTSHYKKCSKTLKNWYMSCVIKLEP